MWLFRNPLAIYYSVICSFHSAITFGLVRLDGSRGFKDNQIV